MLESIQFDPKKMKKFITILALLLVPISIISAYSDIPDDHMYYQSITDLSDSGIIKGYEDGTFKPNDPVNRAEFVKLLVANRSFTLSDQTTDCFSDVSDEWFAKYVCYAKYQGIVDGESDGNFYPERTINLAEASKIIVNALCTDCYGDYSSDDIWYRPYARELSNKAVIPTSVDSLNQDLTRGQVAEMIWRFQQYEIDLFREYTYFSWNIYDTLSIKTGIGYGYFLYGEDIYYYSTKTDIDFDTFEHIDENFFRDKDYIYVSGKAIRDLDPDELEIINDVIVKDDENLYCTSYYSYYGDAFEKLGVDLESLEFLEHGIFLDKDTVYMNCFELEGSDGATFEIMDVNTFTEFGFDFFAKDKNQLYLYGCYFDGCGVQIIEGADANSFEYVSGPVWKDKDNIYYVHEALDYVDADTFELVGEVQGPNGYGYDSLIAFYKDKNNIYYYKDNGVDDYEDFKTYSEADVESFQFENGQFFSDKNATYYIEPRGNTKGVFWSEINRIEGLDYDEHEFVNDYFTKDSDSVHYLTKLVEGADADTFETLGQTIHYGKDKNNVYYNEEAIEDSNPDEFELFEGYSNIGKDDKYLYNYSNTLEVHDSDELQVVDYGDLIDDKYGYCVSYGNGIIKFEPKDLGTFSCLSSKFAKDKYNVYSENGVLEMLNPDETYCGSRISDSTGVRDYYCKDNDYFYLNDELLTDEEYELHYSNY